MEPSLAHQLMEELRAEREARIPRLVEQFDGAIKYNVLLTDHPLLSDAVCIDFAKRWHAVGAARVAEKVEDWSAGIPYGRNLWKDTGAAVMTVEEAFPAGVPKKNKVSETFKLFKE